MDYTYYSSTTATNDIFASIGTGTWVSAVIIAIFSLITTWIIFKKAGQPGWAAIIPIYNLIIMLKVVKLFGKSTAFGVLSIFFSLITDAIIAFGEAKYEG